MALLCYLQVTHAQGDYFPVRGSGSYLAKPDGMTVEETFWKLRKYLSEAAASNQVPLHQCSEPQNVGENEPSA